MLQNGISQANSLIGVILQGSSDPQIGRSPPFTCFPCGLCWAVGHLCNEVTSVFWVTTFVPECTAHRERVRMGLRFAAPWRHASLILSMMEDMDCEILKPQEIISFSPSLPALCFTETHPRGECLSPGLWAPVQPPGVTFILQRQPWVLLPRV